MAVEYFENPLLPGRQMFQCDRHHARLQVESCAEMWRRANESRSAPERLDPCRNCQLGAKHAGVEDVSLSPLRGMSLCARCHSGTTRLIRGHLCPSCYNRELEYRKGRNGKGGTPVRHPPLWNLAIRIQSDGRARIYRRDGVVGTQELVVAALRDEPKQVTISFAGRSPAEHWLQGELFR